MTIEKKLLGTSPIGDSPDVAEVFSTHLYTGNNSTQTITNGIDLTDEGGLLWIKDRLQSQPHFLVDTERGSTASASNHLVSSSTAASSATANEFGGFTSTGFNLVAATVLGATNLLNKRYASFTFRKKSGFFDCVTWTGNGVAGREIAHGLNGPVGMMFVKMTNGAYNWNVYHSGLGATKFLELNTNNGGQTSSAVWNNTAPTDSVFTVGNEYGVNQSGKTYVAYLFADNSSELADNQMIKCGTYSSVSGNQDIDLGWEPQWLLVKKSDGTEDWAIIDSMRGFVHTGNDVSTTANKALLANTNSVEENSGYAVLRPTATGFIARSGLDALYASAGTYIYMAIRAPMMKEPEAATDVFAIDIRTSSEGEGKYVSGFPVDFSLANNYDSTGNTFAGTRLTNAHLQTNSTVSESSSASDYAWDNSDGVGIGESGAFFGGSTNNINWMWKRAKGFMDVVAYSGTGSNRTLPHSLSVIPEMIWVKSRTTAEQWVVYHSSMTLSVGTSPPHRIISYLNLTNRPATNQAWDNNAPTDSVFSIGTPTTVNQSNIPYIAYLFATLAGISKCGSYVGNGSSQTISCGFSAGSRFVLIHRTDDPDDNGVSGHWYVWDSVRGIVAGNDPHNRLNHNASQVDTDDSVDPANSGFIVNQNSATNINVSSGDYIFYAIA